MALAPRLEIRQGQSLVMTPQLQQAIKLLQLSNLELAEYVEQELERNPLLEMRSNDDERGASEEPRDDREREHIVTEETSLSLSETGPRPFAMVISIRIMRMSMPMRAGPTRRMMQPQHPDSPHPTGRTAGRAAAAATMTASSASKRR